MGNVDRSHFVSLHMEPNAPIPPYPSYDFAEEALTECGRERLTLPVLVGLSGDTANGFREVTRGLSLTFSMSKNVLLYLVNIAGSS